MLFKKDKNMNENMRAMLKQQVGDEVYRVVYDKRLVKCRIVAENDHNSVIIETWDYDNKRWSGMNEKEYVDAFKEFPEED